MSALFTPKRRQEVYDSLLEQFKADERITGVISFGTPDKAFTDDFDGIELLVIIEKPSIIDIVFTLWIKRLQDLFASQSSFNFIINDDLHELSILLDDYLQIGMQYRALNRFNLVGSDWCVAFDRDNHIRNYLDNRKMTREQYVQSLYEDHMHAIWQPVVSCVTELRRHNLWKAIAELDLLRKHMVEVAGLRRLEFTQNFLNIDLLPEMFVVQLRHTLPSNLNEVAIRRSLKTTLKMLFTETAVLDKKFNTSYTQQLKSRLNELVDLYA